MASGEERPDLARLLEALPIAVAHARDGLIVWGNPAACLLFGCTLEQAVGRPFLDLVDPLDRPRIAERYRARSEGGIVPDKYELRCVGLDGRRFLAEVQPRAIDERELVVLFEDVTNRVRDTALVAALTELAGRVQRARTFDAVLAVACEGLLDLGMRVSAVQRAERAWVLRHVAIPAEMSVAVEGLLGRPLAGLEIPLDTGGEMQSLMEEMRPSYHDDAWPAVEWLLRMMGLAPDAGTRQALGGAERGRMVIAPLLVHDRRWGALTVVSPNLSRADAAAIGLFAGQVASTMEVIGSLDDLERTHRDLAGIHAVAQATSEQDLGSHLPRLAAIAAGATASDMCILSLFDEERAELVVGATHGLTAELPESVRRRPLRDPVTGTAALGTVPRALALADMPEAQRRAALEQGICHVATVPLQIKGRLAGALGLGRRSDRPYRDDELRAAAILGSQLAIQVENARLYAEAHRRVRLLSVLFSLGRLGSEVLEVAPLADRVVALVGAALAADGSTLHLLRSDRLELVAHRGDSDVSGLGDLPIDESTPAGRAASTRQIMSTEGAPPAAAASVGGRHVVAAPLVAKDRLVGVLCVVRRSDRPFADEEIRLLESSAAQTAIALEHARLFEEARHGVEELRLLLDVGRVITASLDLDQILEQAAGIVTRLVGASNCSILLVDPGTRQLRGVATASPALREKVRTVRISLDETSVAVRSLVERRPVAVADTSTSTEVNPRMVALFGARSVMTVPLEARDEPIGCIVVDDERSRSWTASEMERATLIANQVGVAVVNARLYDDLRRSYGELARAQEELVKRERLAALGELAAVVAHEVRNPVAVVFNALSSLRKILRPTGDAAMLLGIVGEEADRLNRIVGDLLDFARPSDPAIETEPLEAVISEAVDAAVTDSSVAERAVEIRKDVAPDLPQVRIDARMVRQALLNVLLNGLQAMPKGGTLTVRASAEEAQGRRFARVDVIDTGSGMSPDVAAKIFLPFFTTKASGTGLGLAVVKRIMEAHAGDVSVQSQPGAGTRVSLRLPVD
ncbi:MAG: GAF domain-containing protein [Deltaproteobacteria bacterium]|nr:GAF domain-containing protein [Deltaproteobacteria bacterium]